MQINEVNSLWPTRSDDSAQRGSIFWFIVIYRGDTILSLLSGYFAGEGRPPCRPRALENHITIQEVPKAEDPVRRSRIGSGPGLCIKLGMCGGLSQSALSSLSYRSLTVTFCRKSRPIINGRLF